MLKRMLLSLLLSPGSWGQWGGESTGKDFEVQGSEQQPAGSEKRVIQRLSGAKTPPSGLGRVGSQPDSLLASSSLKLPGV